MQQQQAPTGQQQYQPINRAPVSQQAQIPQQRPPQLIRAPITAQVQNLNPNQPINPGAYQPVQNRPQQQQPQQYAPNLSSDGSVRLNQPTQQYRPQIQTQQRPINPTYNPNLQKLSTHLEERTKMATETANPSQPSYLISNTDDVDDVIVRPIGNVSL